MQTTKIKYQHTGRRYLSPRRLKVLWLSVGLTLVWGFFLFPENLFLLLFSAFLYLSARRFIFVNARYLVCGEQIIYFANVARVVLSTSEGQLRLVSSTGKTLKIDRTKFVTNARKPHKIERNQTDKFNRFSAKLIKHILQVQPNAEVVNE